MEISSVSLTFAIMYNGNGPHACTAGGGISDEKLKINKEWPYIEVFRVTAWDI